MSVNSWKAEFYPVPASDCLPEEAIRHSLQKWLGLRPDALKRHGMSVTPGGNIAADGEVRRFPISANTCALCERFYDGAKGDSCTRCPLAIARGGPACDRARDDETEAPWESWSFGHNPEPMIAALEEADRQFTAPQSPPMEEKESLERAIAERRGDL